MTNADRRRWTWRFRRAPTGSPRGRAIAALGLAVLLSAGLPPVGPGAEAQEAGKGFHEAVKAGKIVPPDQFIERIRRDFPGQILRVKVENESHGGSPSWVYEVKILSPDGHVLMLEFDAGSLELLELRGRHDEERHQGDG